MTDKTNTTKAQKTDIEGLLGADKVKPLYERGSFWLVLLILLGILFAVYYFFFRGSQGQVGFVTQPLTKGNLTVEVCQRNDQSHSNRVARQRTVRYRSKG